MENFTHPNKCPECHLGILFGDSIADIPHSGIEGTCDHCGYRGYKLLACSICHRLDWRSNFLKIHDAYVHDGSECAGETKKRTFRKVKPYPRYIQASVVYDIEKSDFDEYLVKLTFHEIDALWQREAWLDPDSIQGASNLAEDDIKELIEQRRQAKWKKINKP